MQTSGGFIGFGNLLLLRANELVATPLRPKGRKQHPGYTSLSRTLNPSVGRASGPLKGSGFTVKGFGPKSFFEDQGLKREQ